MKYLYPFILSFVTTISLSQSLSKTNETIFTKIDSLYREDQFYFVFTYNNLANKPKSLSQNGFSSGVSIGFLRDMPISKNRKTAIAVGLGLGFQKFFQNLKISKQNQIYCYEFVDFSQFNKNKIEQFLIEVPIELRWRNSTPTNHSFFRVHTGFKVGYLFFNKTKYIGDFVATTFNNPDFNKLQYGPYVSVGYNTINLYGYYGLSSVFKQNVVVANQKINMQTFNFGLMFYVL